MKLGGRGVKHRMPMISHTCLQHRFNPALVDLLPAWFRCERLRELDVGCLYRIILMAVDFRLLRAKIAPLRTLVGSGHTTRRSVGRDRTRAVEVIGRGRELLHDPLKYLGGIGDGHTTS